MRERVDVDLLLELVRLHRMAVKKGEVARLLSLSRTTEREYREAIAKGNLLAGSPDDLPSLETLKAAVETHRPVKPPKQQVSSVENFRDRILELADLDLEVQAIYDRLRLEKPEFRGSYDAVKRLLRRTRGATPVSADDVAIPVDTIAGEIAQVDFGEVCHLYDPDEKRVRRAWVFVMVLGFSRRIACRITFDQTIETWLRVHAECFKEFGGVPATVVPDNLKSAVVRCAFGINADPVLNRSYRELARHFGLKIDPTPAYSPEKKGKVESGVHYVKRNFFMGQDRADAKALAVELQRWVDEIANVRVHGTTRRKPIELFEAAEREALRPLPAVAFQPVRWARTKVHRDSHIAFERHLYSVPWRLLGKNVDVRAVLSSVEIYFDDTRVATHVRGTPGLRTTRDEHLPNRRVDLRHRDRGYWEKRAAKIGPKSATLIGEVFDSDAVLSQLRAVQMIVTTLEEVPPARAEAASRRASYYASFSATAVKNILRKGLDLEPLPPIAVPGPDGSGPRFRFARSITEFLQQPVEKTDEPN